MNNDELLKRISELEKKVLELSKKLALNMFGSSHDVVGSSSSDLVLRTRGKIKIQWGSKFIDLLKDGKLNIDTNVIFNVPNKDSIGNKIGIYLTDNGEVYIKYKSKDPIPLLGETGTSYVSFLEPLLTTSLLKYIALLNIGFLYPDRQSLDEQSLQNGIIYIESEKKLYHILNGNLTEYSIKFPNPFSDLFVISKNDNSKGALFILGQGIENSIAFDLLYIYNTLSNSVIDSNLPIQINILNQKVIDINKYYSTFNNILSNLVSSIGSSSERGFRLYMSNGLSILEVDTIIERNGLNSIKIYPEYWLLNNNIIESTDNNIIKFYYKHSYKVGDILRYYLLDGDGNINSVDIVILDIVDDISVTIDAEIETLSNVLVFLILTADTNPIKILSNNIDINPNMARYGNIEALDLKRSDESTITGYGIYAKTGAFLEAQYVKDYILPSDDSSSRFASTEWVNNNILSRIISLEERLEIILDRIAELEKK